MAKRCQCNCDCDELATKVDKPSGMRVCDECAEYDVDSDGDVHCARSGWGKVCPDCDAEIEWGRIQTVQWQANAREGRCDCPGRLWTQTEQGGSWSTSFEAEEVEAEEDDEAGAADYDEAELAVWGAWPQVDGGTRYAMDEPRIARQIEAELRRDPALADACGASVLVEVDDDGSLRPLEWPGRREGAKPPWGAIRAALGEEE